MRTLARLAAAAIVIVVALAAPALAMDIQRVVSPGGIEAWLVRDTSVALTTVEFRWRGGAALEPTGREGVAALATAMLREGAGDLDAQAFQRELEDRSISFGVSADRDSVSGGLRTLNIHRARAAELVALALTRPRFDADSLERVRSQLLVGLQRQAEEPRTMASRVFAAFAYPSHPYSRSRDEIVAGTRAASVQDARAFLAARLARDNLLIAACGDITPAEFGAMVDAMFGALPATAAKDDVAEIAPAIDRARTVVIPRRLPQAVMLFGAGGIKRDDPDWFAGQLVNWILGGGGFNSRLMNEVREKRGLTYGVGTFLSPSDRSATVLGSASTETSNAGVALDLIREEWRRMGEQGPTAEELAAAKAYLTGSFPLALDSTSSIARLLVSIQYDRLGIDYIDRRNALIEAVTLEDARRVARRLYGGPGFLTVIVGQPDGITATDAAPAVH